MALLKEALKHSRAQRIIDVERRESGVRSQGDFEGSVTGHWHKLDDSGAGLVEYKGKIYKTKVLGYTSLPRGAGVELSFAQGLYFSKY